MADTAALREQIAALQLQLAEEEAAQRARERELEVQQELERERRVPRMRTAKGLVALLREEDPGTAVTERMVRRLVKTGELKSIAMGRKNLISAEDMIVWLREHAAVM